MKVLLSLGFFVCSILFRRRGTVLKLSVKPLACLTEIYENSSNKFVLLEEIKWNSTCCCCSLCELQENKSLIVKLIWIS